MDKCNQKKKHSKIQNASCYGEVSSLEWECINMTEQEEDIIRRMHKLVGDNCVRWELIAGRIPGRSAAEIERFWLMKNNTTTGDDDGSNYKRKQRMETKGGKKILDRGPSLHV